MNAGAVSDPTAERAHGEDREPAAREQGSDAPPVIRRMRLAATWFTGLSAVGLLIVVLARYGDVVAAMQSQADMVSPLVLADHASRYSDAFVMTGNYGWWPGLWVVQLLHGLPGGEVLGLRLPGIVSLVAVAALALEARRVWSTLAGFVVVIASLSVGAAAMIFLVAWSGRAPTWWAMIAVAIAIVRLAEPATGRRRTLNVVGAALAVGLAAAVLAGDKMGWAATVAPLLAVSLFFVVRRSWARAAVPMAMGLGIAGGSFVVAALADALGYLHQVYPVESVAFADYGAAVTNALTGLTHVWRGPVANNMDYAAGYAGAIVAVGALIGGAAWVVRRLARSDGDVDAMVRGADRPALEDARDAWMVFWVAALGAMFVAFCVSDVSVVDGEPVPRYLYGVPFAAGAVLAGLAQRRSGWWVSVPVVVLALAAGVASVRAPAPIAASGHTAIVPEVERIAKQHGVTRGYASYWSAYPIQLATDHRLDMVPIGGCYGVDPYTLCPMYLHYVDRAFEPAARKSFALTDSAGAPPVAHWSWLITIPKGIRPTHRFDVGEGVTMYLFDFDLARHLVPNAHVQLPAGSGAPMLRPAKRS